MSKESIFAGEFKKSCEEFGAYYCKIPDAYGMARFAPPKPFDAFMVYDGQPFCLEFKFQKTKTGFAFNKVQQHQIEGLIQAKEHGAKSFIIINIRLKGFNKAFYMDVVDFGRLWNKSEHASISFADLEKYPCMERVPAPSGNGRVWDINKLLML